MQNDVERKGIKDKKGEIRGQNKERERSVVEMKVKEWGRDNKG